MKMKFLFVVLFVAGLAASIALASPSGAGGRKPCATTSGATTTSATTTTGPLQTTTATTTTKRGGDDNEQHGNHQGDNGRHECKTTSGTTATTTTGTTTTGPLSTCRRVQLRGTLAAGTVSMTVDSSTSKRVRSLAGTAVTLAVPAGPGRIGARLCTDAAGKQTLQLESLKAGTSSDG